MLKHLRIIEMNNKYLRYSLGFILLVLILISFYSSPILQIILSVLFICAAMYEYRNMFKSQKIYIHRFLPELTGIYFATVFILNHNSFTQIYVLPVLIISFILSFVLTVIQNKKPYIITSFATFMSIFFIICGLYIIKLTYYFNNKSSALVILLYFITVLAGDYTASIVGQKFGKIPLAKDISPNKTIEGSLANFAVTEILCLLFTLFINIKVYQAIILGGAISCFSQLGDLTISTIKRDLGLKHSSGLFYGYGGILDRLDAFIFSAPVAYYLLILFTFF